MTQKYAEWITANVTNSTGKCKHFAEQMADQFPDELKLIRGHYYDCVWGEREHWWCVNKNTNEIVDPTAGQFPSKGAGPYVPWPDNKEEPTGLCPNCGEYAYDNQTCCSEECHNSYARYITAEAHSWGRY